MPRWATYADFDAHYLDVRLNPEWLRLGPEANITFITTPPAVPFDPLTYAGELWWETLSLNPDGSTKVTLTPIPSVAR